MIDQELKEAQAAKYLSEKLGDGRSYSDLLERMRRGLCKRNVIPHHNHGRQAWYYLSDLEEFIRAEEPFLKLRPSAYEVDRDSSRQASWAKPKRRIRVLH